MQTQIEYRKYKRYDRLAVALLEDQRSGHITYAHMINTSGGGMGFESYYPLIPGSEISITLDKPLFKTATNGYRGIVRWCLKTEISHPQSNFSFGVQLL